MSGSHLFPGGVHPKEGFNGKAVTGSLAVKPITPAPARVIIPMQQHIGAPCKPVVKAGDQVRVGQVIGEATGFVSAPVHASVSGTVVAVAPCMLCNGQQVESVIIDNDFQDTWVELPTELPQEPTAKELAEIVRNAGIVGLGGATFPTAVKFSPPEGQKIDTLVINGAECEPYLSADHRLMLENADEMLDGIAIVKKALGIERAIIGIENNKPDAIALLTEKAASMDGITVRGLPVMYPQGGEKQLVYALTKRRVPNGALPLSIGCLVCNVGTMAVVSAAVRKGRPIIERIVTVGGMVASPGNFLVRIGTPIETLLEVAGDTLPGVRKLVYGGPMMGMAVSRRDIPVTKGCSGLLALGDEAVTPVESACMRCARCSKGCPMVLMPMLIDQYVRKEMFEDAERMGVMNCIECGICSFVCPAKRHLTQSMRIGKAGVTKMKRRAAAKKEG